jgi:hypothetical protein
MALSNSGGWQGSRGAKNKPLQESGGACKAAESQQQALVTIVVELVRQW